MCFRGNSCTTEDDSDLEHMRLARFNAPKMAMLVLKSQMQGTGGTNVLGRDHLVRPRGCLGGTARYDSPGREQCSLFLITPGSHWRWLPWCCSCGRRWERLPPLATGILPSSLSDIPCSEISVKSELRQKEHVMGGRAGSITGHHGSGLVQNTSACSDLPEDTECWQTCLAHQEVGPTSLNLASYVVTCVN